jgi:hypothetical protein
MRKPISLAVKWFFYTTFGILVIVFVVYKPLLLDFLKNLREGAIDSSIYKKILVKINEKTQ